MLTLNHLTECLNKGIITIKLNKVLIMTRLHAPVSYCAHKQELFRNSLKTHYSTFLPSLPPNMFLPIISLLSLFNDVHVSFISYVAVMAVCFAVLSEDYVSIRSQCVH